MSHFGFQRIQLLSLLITLATAQYNQIWYDTGNQKSQYTCSGGWGVDGDWTKKCYIPYDDSPDNGCASNPCNLLCASLGSGGYIQRVTTISAYSSVQLIVGKASSYDNEGGNSCRIYYKLGSGSWVLAWSKGGEDIRSAFYTNFVPFTVNTNGATSISLRFQINADSQDCDDACYFDNIELLGEPKPS